MSFAETLVYGLWCLRWRLLPLRAASRPSNLLNRIRLRYARIFVCCPSCGRLCVRRYQGGWFQCNWCDFALPLREPPWEEGADDDAHD